MASQVLVAGAGGFIGGHLVKRLKAEGYWVRGVDLKHNEFTPSPADEFTIGGLRQYAVAQAAVDAIEDVCRKVAEVPADGEIELWGDGEQTRSFLYIDECLEGVRRLMESQFAAPVNIGSGEMVTINALARMAMDISGKPLRLRHISGPLGVRGRTSDNRLIAERLGWTPSRPLIEGMEKTYK